MDIRERLQGRWWLILVALLFLVLIIETVHFGWQALNVEGPPTATLALEVSGSGSVNPKEGVHRFEKETFIIIEAEPNEGWVFSHWIGPVADEKSPRTTLTLDQDLELKAVFVEEEPGFYAYTIDVKGGGEVFPGEGCHEFWSAEEGSLIPVKAVPAPGYAFDKWTLNGREVSRNPYYEFALMDGAVLTAHFKHLYAVTVDSTSGGSVRGPAGLLEKGDRVKVEAISAPGYSFKEWVENDKVISESPVYTFTVEGDRHLTARFLPTYKVNVSSTRGGRAYASHAVAMEGTKVRAVAQANPGYAFVQWTEGGKAVAAGIDLGVAFIPLNRVKTSDYRFTLDRDRNLIAEFARVYPINVKVAGNRGGSVKTPGKTALKGQKSVIIAVPDKGYLFDKWTEGNKEYYGEVFKFWGNRPLKLTAHFVPAIEIGVSAEPKNGGEVKGGGAYKPGEEVLVKAAPAEYHRFVGWYEDGRMVCDEPEYTFTATKSCRLAAKFEPDVEITARVSPAAAGRVRGAGFYEKGSEVVLTAIPNLGYEFEYWLKDGVKVEGAAAQYRFTADGSSLFEAVFKKVNEYTVSLTSSIPGAGSLSGGGTFNEGTRVSVFAIPKVKYRFNNWTEDGEEVSQEPNYSFVLDKDRCLVANFKELFFLGASADPKVGGRVEGRGYYTAGSQVNIEAIPSYGYRFDHWAEEGELYGYDSSITLIVNQNYALTAHFVKAHQVSISFAEFMGGTVRGEGLYDVGDTVTVTAEPFDGYIFAKWTENGVEKSDQLEYQFTMPDKPVQLVAHFLPLYDIRVNASPGEGGAVSGGGTYVRGERVTVEAVANPGYDFYRWEKDGSPVSYSQIYSFYAEESGTMTAVFRPLRQITLEGTPPEGFQQVTANWKYADEMRHPEGENITINAIPAAGYSFVKWTVGSAAGETLLDQYGQPAGRVHTFAVGGTDLHLVAHFDAIPSYEVTVEADPPGWGTVEGGDIYQEGSQATVKATPNPGYYFSKWTEGGQQVSTNPTYSFTVTGPRHLVAHFIGPVTVRAYSSNSSQGQVSIVHPGGTTAQAADVSVSVAPGSSVTLQSHAASGYKHEGWYEGSTRLSTSANYAVTVSSNRVFEARYTKSSSCPFVYSFNEAGAHFENEAIPQFLSKALENTYYGTLHELQEVDGKYHLRIAEELQEKSFINWFQLFAVDYPADSGITEVIADIHGQPQTIKERIKPLSFTDDRGKSWLEEVTTNGLLVQSDYRDFLEGKPTVTYEAEFAAASSIPSEAKLMIRLKAEDLPLICWDWFMDRVDCKNNQWWIDEILNRDPLKEKFINFTDIVALRVELWNGSEWLPQGLVRPGIVHQEYLVPIDLSAIDSASETIKIRFKSGSGFFVFDTVSIDLSENEIVALTELKPESVLFNGEKDVFDELCKENNEQRVRLLTGETIDLVYDAPALPEGHGRGFMAFLHGYYHAHPEVVENPATNYWKELSAAEIVARVLKTIPEAVRITPELIRMYRLMESVTELPFEEKVAEIIVDHVLPWMEQERLE